MADICLTEYECRVVGYADGATDPVDFPIAPKFAVDKLLKQTGMNAQQVDLWEINEAFSVVVLANMKLSELDPAKAGLLIDRNRKSNISGFW